MPKSKPVHYVDNEKFLKEMVIYKDQFNQAKKDGSPPPQISEYLGECFMKIAQRLSYRPNFINYAFRDDMISDGIENCVQYIKNFDPEKSNNPFAYFTQIIYYAFLRRIQAEKKQVHIKNKTIEKQHYEPYVTLPGDDVVYSVDQTLINNMLPDEDVYKPKKKESVSSKGLEVFMEKED